jgi:glycosyltransferase involved in cell wall biosynthesis
MLAEPGDHPDPSRPGADNDAATDPLAARTIALDCRWLGIGGAGRVTELLLASFRTAPPQGRWLLWGEPDRVSPLAFPDATVAPWRGHPAAWFAQADFLRVPRADVVVYLHQVRPLRPGRSVTVVHDTIPLHFEPRRPVRLVKRLFLQVACRLSGKIVTVSPASRDAIGRDLRVPARKIVVTTLGVDPEHSVRIRRLRSSLERGDFVLYVGRFAKHKNLPALCRAFQRTTFKHDGGRLILVGGSAREVAKMSALLANDGLGGIDVRGECTDDELDGLMASCRALVQPSLEEGYGLPPVEAAAVGIPVAATPTGFAPNIPGPLVSLMDPRDDSSIATAIDDVTARADATMEWSPAPTIGRDILRASVEVLR